MASSNLIKQLQERGLVAQVTDEEALLPARYWQTLLR